MAGVHKATIITITDHNFVIAVYLLIASLKFHKVKADINVLGVDLTNDEKRLLEQFPGVRVFDADLSNRRNACTRKGEALLTARNDATEYIALLDGDVLAIGDVTPYLAPGEKALYVRTREPIEDACVFASRYAPDETPGSIPRAILDVWRRDVGGVGESRIRNSVLAGNLTIHSDFLDFARLWHEQILKVLQENVSEVHDYGSFAYSHTDESVLNSLLAFSVNAPPVRRGVLDSDQNAYLAHLGPGSPRHWVLWRKTKLEYFDVVVNLLNWARREGYVLPRIPWTFKRRNKWLVYIAAYSYEVGVSLKLVLRRVLPRRKLSLV